MYSAFHCTLYSDIRSTMLPSLSRTRYPVIIPVYLCGSLIKHLDPESSIITSTIICDIGPVKHCSGVANGAMFYCGEIKVRRKNHVKEALMQVKAEVMFLARMPT